MSLEAKLMVEIDAAAEIFEKSKGSRIKMRHIFRKLIGNVIHGIILGCRKTFEDPDFEKVQKLTEVAVNSQGPLSLGLYLPILITWILSRQDGQNASLRQNIFDKIKNYILDEVIQHQKTFDENNIRDFIVLYIQVSRGSKDDVFTKGNMFRVIMELFFVGLKTTYKTLDRAFLFMAEFQEIQRKCQIELDKAIGDKQIEYADRIKLKNVDAILTEIQRHANDTQSFALRKFRHNIYGLLFPKEHCYNTELILGEFRP